MYQFQNKSVIWRDGSKDDDDDERLNIVYQCNGLFCWCFFAPLFFLFSQNLVLTAHTSIYVSIAISQINWSYRHSFFVCKIVSRRNCSAYTIWTGVSRSKGSVFSEGENEREEESVWGRGEGVEYTKMKYFCQWLWDDNNRARGAYAWRNYCINYYFKSHVICAAVMSTVCKWNRV